MDQILDHTGLKMDGALRSAGFTSSTIENRSQLGSQIANGFDLPHYTLGHPNANLSSGKHIFEAGSAACSSLPSFIDHDQRARTNLNMESASYLLDGNKMNLMGAHYENGLFSSSMSDLFNRKLILSSNDTSYGHPVGASGSYYEEEEKFESLKELEALTIGDLLPDDDDLLSGVTDGYDHSAQPNDRDAMEDQDLFISVGGMELGDDNSSQANFKISKENSIYGVLGCRDHGSRTLVVRNINTNVEDSELQMVFEQYGNIHTLSTTCKHHGFIMVSYYDIRAAINALKALQNKQFQGRKLDVHFSSSKENSLEHDINQDALVVSHLDYAISDGELREIFGIYGEIKEIHETSFRSQHKFIEFYDVRAAESARRAFNKGDLSGKEIKLDRGRPGGFPRFMQPLSSELKHDDSNLLLHHASPNVLVTGISGSLPRENTTTRTDNGTIPCPLLDNVYHPVVSSSISNSLPSLIRDPSHLGEGHLRNRLKFELQGMPNLHPHSLMEYQDSLSSRPPFGSPSNITASIYSRSPEVLDNGQFHRVSSNGQPNELNEGFGSSGNGAHYMWSNSHHSQPQSILWKNSPSFGNGIGASLPQHMNAVPRAASHMLNALLPLNNHHGGSAPSVNIWDRRHAYTGESPDAAVFHPGSLGTMRIPGNSPHPLEFVPHTMFPRTGGNGMDLSIPSKSNGVHQHQRCMFFPSRGQMIPMMNSFDSPNERVRNRKSEGNSGQAENKRQFELDVERIMRGEDQRTTLMIKNIPNKYTSKMLLAAIDERHRGTYDFIYLPIDFKNKCNVGYAFINMIDPSLIVPFYQTFNGKKWEKFNSEKVASLAYARIQGKAALIAHFQNSSLMNEDKRCRPILFHTEGPNAGDQVPFPMGTNIRPRPGKARTSSSEECNQETSSNSLTENYSNGDSSSGSGKESD